MALKKLMVKAVPLYQELQDLTSKPVKLSAKGCLAMALSIAGCDEAVVMELGGRLDEDSESFRYSNQFVRNAVRWIKERTFTMPPKDVRRLTWLSGPHFDSVIAELGGSGFSVFSLMALAIYRTTQSHPECFGTIDDISQYHVRVAELNKKLDDIYHQLEESYDGKDLLFSSINAEGYAKVSFKISNGEIAVTTDCGKKLIAWCSQNRHVLEG